MGDGAMSFGIYIALLIIAVASLSQCSAQQDIHHDLQNMKVCKS